MIINMCFDTQLDKSRTTHIYHFCIQNMLCCQQVHCAIATGHWNRQASRSIIIRYLFTIAGERQMENETL